jgi:hypothetical protein
MAGHTKFSYQGQREKDWQGLVRAVQGGAITVTATCACGHTDSVESTRALPPQVFVKKFATNMGWALGKNPTCPTCRNAHHGTHHSSEEQQDMADQHTNPKLAVSNDHTQQSDAARRAKRFAMMALEDAYEEGVGYKPGWDDDRIAKDVGLAPAKVAAIREEYFGPAAPPMPPEAVELAANMATLRSELQALTSTANTVAGKLAELEARHAAIVKANKWRS